MNGFYGMPAEPAPVAGRDAIAAQLAARQSGAPPAPDQRLALNAPPQDARSAVTDIRPAPPVPSQIRAAQPAPQPAPQPQQVAQTTHQQAIQDGYVMPVPKEPAPPPRLGLTDVESKVIKAIQDDPNNEALKVQLKPLMDEAAAGRAYKQQQLDADYKDKMIAHRELVKQREEQLSSASTRNEQAQKEREAVKKARAENAVREQFGNMEPAQVFKTIEESSKVAQSAAKSLEASRQAMDAFKQGAITGFGADKKLDIAKLFTAMGLVDKGNIIANTETFKGAMQPVIASILHQTSGTSQLSEGELYFAKNAAAGNITLDPKSIQQLMTIIDKGSRGVIEDHQRKMDVLFPNNPQAKATFGVEMPAQGPREFKSEAEAAAAGLKPGTKVRINGRSGTVQ